MKAGRKNKKEYIEIFSEFIEKNKKLKEREFKIRLVWLLTDIIAENNKSKNDNETEVALQNEVWSIIKYCDINRSVKSKATAEIIYKILNKINGSLNKRKEYDSYICVHNIMDFPIGKSFGDIKIVEYQDIPIDDTLDKFIKKRLEQYKDYDPKSGLWIKCKFHSYYTSASILPDFWKSINPFLGMLSILHNGIPIEEKSIIGIIPSEDTNIHIGIKDDEYLATGWARYTSRNKEKYLLILEDILNKKQNETKLIKKVKLSAQVFYLSFQASSRSIQFLMVVTALESLLLDRDDRDYLRLKLSEKVAFLIGSSQNDRIKLFKYVRDLYDKRSTMVHGGEIRLTFRELGRAKRLYVDVYRRMLELSNNYTSVKSNKGKGIDDLINELKFN